MSEITATAFVNLSPSEIRIRYLPSGAHGTVEIFFGSSLQLTLDRLTAGELAKQLGWAMETDFSPSGPQEIVAHGPLPSGGGQAG